MEIVYITDVHDNLRGLKKVFEKERPDLFIISGDLIYRAFFTEDKLYHFVDVQESLYQYIRKHNLNLDAYDLCTAILKNPQNYPVKLQHLAKEYKSMYFKAIEVMKKKYDLLRRLTGRYATSEVFFLPGNYDMDLQYTSLATQDMHKKFRKVLGISFAGYGGAPIYTPGIPEKISVIFREYKENGKLYSEPKEFFQRVNPEVLIIHNPAYGTLDRLFSYGHCGSIGIRDYLDQSRVRLVLSGHIHEDYGLLKIGQTFCLNPANFGKVDSFGGLKAGGYYCRIYLQKDQELFLRKVQLLRLVENEVVPILQIKIDKNLRCQEIIENPKEFHNLGHFLR